MDEKVEENFDLDIRFHKKITDVSGFLCQNFGKKKEFFSDKELFDEVNGDQTLKPLEYYLNVETKQRSDLFFKGIQEFDIVIGKVINIIGGNVSIRILSILHGQQRWISDLNIMADARIPEDKHNDENQIEAGEQVVGTVVYKNEESKQLRLALEDVPSLSLYNKKTFFQVKNNHSGFREEMFAREIDASCVEDMQSYWIFNHPQCIELHSNLLDLDESRDSFLNKSSSNFQESVEGLRDKQSYKWSMNMVGNGVKHFREKNFKDAWKCFDQAISFYPANVEGFVARGALKANRNDLQGAIQDFQEALKLNPLHNNGKKYFIETSLSMARRYESKKEWKDASRCYREILKLEPTHAESKERYQQILQLLSNKIVTGKAKSATVKSSPNQEISSVRRKERSSSSSSSSSSVSESEQSSSNDWVEKTSPKRKYSFDRDKKTFVRKPPSADTKECLRKESSKRTETDSKTRNHTKRTGNDSKVHHPKTDALVRKLKSFSSEDLQLVSQLLQSDSNQTNSEKNDCQKIKVDEKQTSDSSRASSSKRSKHRSPSDKSSNDVYSSHLHSRSRVHEHSSKRKKIKDNY